MMRVMTTVSSGKATFRWLFFFSTLRLRIKAHRRTSAVLRGWMSIMANDHTRAFTRLFNETARYHHRYEVFRDFVMMAGIAIQNAFLKSDELEQEYLGIVRRYEKDDAVRMSQLLAEVVMGLEAYPCDFLGSVFMDLELGSDRMGQFFTPFEVSKMMAMIVHGDTISALSKKPFITMQEPACGAGGMVIALAQTMYEKGFNPQKQLWASCIDVDPVAAMMAYVQLSLLHIPAEVVIGNSLSMKFTRVMRTPAHYLGFWDSKLRRHWSNDESEDTQTIEDAPTAELQPIVVTQRGQMSLFDMTT